MRSFYIILSALLVVTYAPRQRAVHQEPASAPVEVALVNDNRVPAGRLADGVLTLELETREAVWYPEGDAGVAIPIYAFAEAGSRTPVPGPMIRVPAGTEIRLSLRNTLPKEMIVRGLSDRVSAARDTTVIASGATQEFRFRVSSPGSYYYHARTEPMPSAEGFGRGRDALLVGALIVDSVGARVRPGERVLVISTWEGPIASLGPKSENADLVLRREGFARNVWFVAAINGRSWPHTERLSYNVGDTVHYRLINTNRFPHPMHLHGFYFDVNARGGAQSDTVLAPEQRRHVVTERMNSGTTLQITWVATRPGNWLFHCHFPTHMTDLMRLRATPNPKASRHNHAEDGMGGLVMGIRVAPNGATQPLAAERPRRKLRLYITERAKVYGDRPGYSYVLQEGSVPPARDSIRAPSSMIVLRQNEPTEITVFNSSGEHATIHWHGLELESFYDGVGDWSGWGSSTAPAIAPNDSFVVRLTPPRAGTFMYHAHTDEGIKLVSGQYGALIILPENPPAATNEQVFLLGIGGPLDDGRPLINGVQAPAPIELRAGVAYRFRFINIAPIEARTVQIVSGAEIQTWRALAKDGADLPPQQATNRPGSVVLHPGETYDFEIRRPRPDSLALKFIGVETTAGRRAFVASRRPGETLPRIIVEVPLVFR